MIWRALFAAVVAFGFLFAAWLEPVKAPHQDRRTHAWVVNTASRCFPRTPLGSLYSFVTGRQRSVIHAFIWGELTPIEFVTLARHVKLSDERIYCIVMDNRRSA